MPEPAAHSAEARTATQEEIGYIRLPYNMNCHTYTRSSKKHKYFKCKQQKNGDLDWSLNQEKKLPSPCQKQRNSSINDIQFPPGSLSCLNCFLYQKGWQDSQALFRAGALNDCLLLWILSWSCHLTGYKVVTRPLLPTSHQLSRHLQEASTLGSPLSLVT